MASVSNEYLLILIFTFLAALPYFPMVLASLPTATTTSPSGTPAMTPAAPQKELVGLL